MKTIYKHLGVALACTAFFLIPPFWAVRFVEGHAGIGVMLLLFLVIDPLYALGMGILAGLRVRRFWYVPVLNAFLFWAGACLSLEEMNPDFLVYTLAYLLIGGVAAAAARGIAWAAQKHKEKKAAP